MANFRAIHLVGASLVRYLSSAFSLALPDPFPPFTFKLISSGEMNGTNVDFSRTVTLYLYRVTVDPFTRNVPATNALSDLDVPLSLNLHYLVTIWADTAQEEQTVLGWVMRELYEHQALSPSDLNPDGGWSGSDVIQVVPSEITTEDMMRIWDALDPGYRVSVSYTARVVRIDALAPSDEAGRRVAARRLSIASNGPSGGGAP